MNKILYLTYDGLTDPLGQSQILPYLKYLSAQGYRFTILSFEKQERFQKEKKIVQELASASGIEWVPLSFTTKPPVLSKMYDRYRMWRKAIQLHKKNSFDLIHCRSYVAAETGLKMKNKFGVKMLFDMRGFWADEKVDNGQWDLKKTFFKRLYRHYKKKEKAFLLQADGIISLTQAAKDFLLKQNGYQHLSITVIPTCADLQHFDYHQIKTTVQQAIRRQLHLEQHDKVITYLGSVGGWYMTIEMFRFFKELLKEQPLYKMLILTKDDAESVKKEAMEQGIPPEKIIVTYSDRKNLPNYLAVSDCSIFFIRNTFSKTASSPTKLAELMGMGIPVVCNDIGDTGQIVTATGAGLLINEFDLVSIQNAIKQMPALENLEKEFIRQSAKKYFDLQAGAAKYSDVYRHILQNN